MRKKLLLLALLINLMSFAKAQNVYIIDSLFRNYLLSNPAINTNADTSISMLEASSYSDTIDIWHLHVKTLSGIENFVNIKGLNCEGECCGLIGLLKALDLTSNTKLNFLNCFNNQIHSLDLSHNPDLQYLNVGTNPITHLDLTNNIALTDLYCVSDSLSTIDVSGATLLQQFFCTSNQLTNINVASNLSLKAFYCSNNNLTGIDVSNNLALEELVCVSDSLTSLDITKNSLLSYFYCFGNPKLDSICVNSVGYAIAQEVTGSYMKDSTSKWSESCVGMGISTNDRNHVSISPNPGKGLFIFSGLDRESTIEIFDLTGRSVSKTFSDEPVLNIDLSQKEKGIYMYRIIDKSPNAHLGKLILQ
ncbi:MAG: T9SS type A sorting domain-containing protein [Bacteroidetes bacterium]|nr:T9SS type A sorting domain-containing protein [Bacteroidota bacterium]